MTGGRFNTLWIGTYGVNAMDGRFLTSLVAPGVNILVPPVGGGAYALDSGTSFAAPHVTGTVALLHEYAESLIISCPGSFDADSRQHEVMKAVLMNSVDKIEDDGTGRMLGMEKTIYQILGGTWLTSTARDEANNPGGSALPVDDELGTGQLNAARAVTQFAAGEQEPGEVRSIGWDYRENPTGAGTKTKYVINRPLVGTSYVSIMLVWDRWVDLAILDDVYDEGDQFTVYPIVNLDLHLHLKNAPDNAVPLWSSNSTLYNVEHIFFQLPPGDADYEFWVHHNGTGDPKKYAVAWWTLPTIPPQPV